MRREVLQVLSTAVFALATVNPVYAAPKKANKPIKSGITRQTVTVVIKKKKISARVFCYQQVAGVARKVKGGFAFQSYKSLIKKTPKKKVLYKALDKAAEAICTNGGGTTLGPMPDHLSLAPYTGPFGEHEARVLFDRFAFSASPERINQAVSDGLATTISKLTTYVPEPSLDAIENNMRCNGLLPGDPRNGTKDYKCDATDPNDIDMGGLKSALLYRHWYSQNSFFERLGFFIHDRFQSVNTRVLNGCSTWAVVPYVNLLRRAAQSGDYIQYLRDFGNDYLGAIVWLHLLDSTYVSPNEDEAREILQLAGTGPYNLDGSPVYGDLDIAQNALALTGWVETDYEDANGHRICVPAYSPQLHAPGPFRLFIGSPYESQISNLEDVVQAIKRHPRLAENIAENIYDEFINPFATPEAIRDLAAVIRQNDYNMVKVLKTVMSSKAIFAQKSQRSIPKQPLEVLIGFLRITGMPLNGDYTTLRSLADQLGQVDLSPNTVFGWRNRDALAGEGFVLNRRNVLINLLNQDISKLGEKGYTYWDRFLRDLPAGVPASSQFIARLQSWFHVSLNAAQVATLSQYLDYDQHECNQYTRCEPGQKYYLERNQFDPAVDSTSEGRASQSTKTRGAIALITMMPDFMLK